MGWKHFKLKMKKMNSKWNWFKRKNNFILLLFILLSGQCVFGRQLKLIRMKTLSKYFCCLVSENIVKILMLLLFFPQTASQHSLMTLHSSAPLEKHCKNIFFMKLLKRLKYFLVILVWHWKYNETQKYKYCYLSKCAHTERQKDRQTNTAPNGM